MILLCSESPLYLARLLIITVLSCIPIFHSTSSRNSLMISSRNWMSSLLVSKAELHWILESSVFLYLSISILSWWVIVVKNYRRSSTCWVQEKKNDIPSLHWAAVFLAHDFVITNFSTTAGCYGTLNTNNFLFYFILFFSWFYFSFSLFYFPGKTRKQACDKEVTWQVTWCDIIGLEGGRRI